MPRVATRVTFAPPTRSAIGPAMIRAAEPIRAPQNTYLAGSRPAAPNVSAPKRFLISRPNWAARPEKVPKVIT